MAGYSATPLPKKLGLTESGLLVLVQAPADFERQLEPLPPKARITRAIPSRFDMGMVFASDAANLEKRFGALSRRLPPAGMLWVAWPKKSARVDSGLTEDVVRQIGLAAGLVDVKVCAVDETWSGLKFVYRVSDRRKS